MKCIPTLPKPTGIELKKSAFAITPLKYPSHVSIFYGGLYESEWSAI